MLGVLDMIVWDPFHCEYLVPGNISRYFYDILKAFLRWTVFHGLCSLLLLQFGVFDIIGTGITHAFQKSLSPR